MAEAAELSRSARARSASSGKRSAGTGGGGNDAASYYSNPLRGDGASVRTMSDVDKVDLMLSPRSADKRRRTKLCAAVALIIVVVGAVGVATLVWQQSRGGSVIPETFSGSFVARSRFAPTAESEVQGRFLKRAPGLNVSEVEMTYTYKDVYSGLRERVTVLHGRAYLEVFNESVSATSPVSVMCMPPSRIPPLSDVRTVLSNVIEVPAWRVDAANEHAAPCLTTGKRWMMTWGRLEAVLCQPFDSTNLIATETFYATFTKDSVTVDSLDVSVPVDPTTGEPQQCTPLPTNTSALNIGTNPSRSRRGLRGRGRKLTTRPCMFVHGLGNTVDGSPAASLNSFFGAQLVPAVSPYCSSTSFVQMDVVNKAWDDPTLAAAFCDAAGAVGTGPTPETIIFSHGVGSLIVANAFVSSRCSKGGSTKWYSMMAPWQGARAAGSAADGTLCPLAAGLQGDQDVGVLAALGLCVGSMPTIASTALAPGYSGAGATFSELESFASSNLDGAMCGEDRYGIYQGIGRQLVGVADSTVPFGVSTDGIVDEDSCDDVEDWWEWDFFLDSDSEYYEAEINHLDGTTRYGDEYLDVFGVASPLLWVQYMAQR